MTAAREYSRSEKKLKQYWVGLTQMEQDDLSGTTVWSAGIGSLRRFWMSEYNKTIDEIMEDREPGSVWCESDLGIKFRPYFKAAYRHDGIWWHGIGGRDRYDWKSGDFIAWREIPNPTKKVELPGEMFGRNSFSQDDAINKIIGYLKAREE